MAFENLGQLKELGHLSVDYRGFDSPKWQAMWTVEKNWKAADANHDAGDYEIIHGKGNVLLNGGADVIWERLITNNPTTAANAALSAFSTLAMIGVGNSTAAASASQTALQATTANRAYKGMEATYPTHTTGTSTAARTASYRAIFSTAQANFAWQEWGVFNSTNAAGRMLNRKQQSLGTKTSAAQWTFTVTLTLS